MAKTPAARLGAMVLAVVAVTSALFGGCVATVIHRQSAQEAEYETQTGGMAPSATSDGYGSFSPSDAAPRCLPAGTVCYEVYDEAAHMRYWVFRWPEGAGYSVVPRVTTDADGQIIGYQPPSYGGSEQ